MQSVSVFGLQFASDADAIGYMLLACLGLLTLFVLIAAAIVQYHGRGGPDAAFKRERERDDRKRRRIIMQLKRERIAALLSNMRY